jgi:hypothetical protein
MQKHFPWILSSYVFFALCLSAQATMEEESFPFKMVSSGVNNSNLNQHLGVSMFECTALHPAKITDNLVEETLPYMPLAVRVELEDIIDFLPEIVQMKIEALERTPCEAIICAQNVPWASQTMMRAYYHYAFFKEAPLKMKPSRKEVLNASDRNYRKVINIFAYIPGNNEVVVENQKILTLHGNGSRKPAIDTRLSGNPGGSGLKLTTAKKLVGRPVFTLGTELFENHPHHSCLTITLPLREDQLNVFQKMLDLLDQRMPLVLESIIKQIAFTPPFKKSHFAHLFASIVQKKEGETPLEFGPLTSPPLEDSVIVNIQNERSPLLGQREDQAERSCWSWRSYIKPVCCFLGGVVVGSAVTYLIIKKSDNPV